VVAIGELDAGTLGVRAASACADYWQPIVHDVDSEWYGAATLEQGDADRAESLLFEGVPPPPLPPSPSRPVRMVQSLTRQLSARLSAAVPNHVASAS